MGIQGRQEKKGSAIGKEMGGGRSWGKNGLLTGQQPAAEGVSLRGVPGRVSRSLHTGSRVRLQQQQPAVVTCLCTPDL